MFVSSARNRLRCVFVQGVCCTFNFLVQKKKKKWTNCDKYNATKSICESQYFVTLCIVTVILCTLCVFNVQQVLRGSASICLVHALKKKEKTQGVFVSDVIVPCLIPCKRIDKKKNRLSVCSKKIYNDTKKVQRASSVAQQTHRKV